MINSYFPGSFQLHRSPVLNLPDMQILFSVKVSSEKQFELGLLLKAVRFTQHKINSATL